MATSATPGSRMPILRAFSGPRAIANRRIAVMGIIVFGLLAYGAYRLLSQKVVHTPTVVARTPPVNNLPGGSKASPRYTMLAKQASQANAATAIHNGNSSVPSLPGSVPVNEQAVVVPQPAAPVNLGVGEVTKVAYTPPSSPPPKPAAAALDDRRVSAYSDQIKGVLAALAGTPGFTFVAIKPVPLPQAEPPANATGSSTVQPVSDPPPSSSSAPPQMQVLVPAGHGVYARTITGSSSDQPGPIIVVAESGPIAGDRMIGSFTRRGDRLVVTLTSLTLPSGKSVAIDALMVAPDSMETAVASSVDQHYVSRFVLPVAAAFVQGLGQALAQSNAVVQSSPLGGVTQFYHLNLGQEIGVAAGTAGQIGGGLITAAAPHGPTVALAANVDVGVLFLKPLEVPQ